MTTKDAYIERLENTIKDLRNQVSNLTEMVMLLRKEKFGSSSEKTPKQIEGQLSLFNEAELVHNRKHGVVYIHTDLAHCFHFSFCRYPVRSGCRKYTVCHR